MPAGLDHHLRGARLGPGAEHRIPPVLRTLAVGRRVGFLRILHRVIDDAQAVAAAGGATADTNGPHAARCNGVPAVRRPAGCIEGAAIGLVVGAGFAAEALGELSAVGRQAHPAGRVPAQVVGGEQTGGQQALGVPGRQHDHQPGEAAISDRLQGIEQHVDVPVELEGRRNGADEVAEGAGGGAADAGLGRQLPLSLPLGPVEQLSCQAHCPPPAGVRLRLLSPGSGSRAAQAAGPAAP